MAKKGEIKKRYFVLGKEASIFYDPKTELKVLSHDQKNPDVYEKGITTGMMQLALGAGHIVELDAPVAEAKKVSEKGADEEELNAEQTALKAKLDPMTDEELQNYYTENYSEVTDKDLKKFNKLTREARITFLIED